MEFLALVLVWLLLMVLKGFFSGSEIAVVSSDKIKLRAHAEQGHTGSRLALGMFQRPERLLATTLVGTNIATVSLAVLTTILFLELFGDGGDLLALLVGTPILLIFGEIVPKSVYQQSADKLTPVIAYPLKIFSWLFFPAVLVFSTVARLLAKAFIGKRSRRTLFVVREQLRTLIDISERAADLTVFDRVRIKNVIRFADITVGEAMTPITNVVGVSRDASVLDVAKAARKSGHRHLPVYEGNVSNITAIVSVSTWDLIDPDFTKAALKDIVQKPFYVMAREPVDELLSHLTRREDQTAIVVDEYGSAIGLVTVNDITRLIVGQIGEVKSEAASEKAELVEYGLAVEDTYFVDAHLRISELNELLGTDLTADIFHTIGGFMASRLRGIPEVDDSIEELDFRFTVVEAIARGPTKIKIERI